MKPIFQIAAAVFIITFIAIAPVSGKLPYPSTAIRVYAYDSAGNLLDSTEADLSGNYHFEKLEKGEYSIVFKRYGYQDIPMNLWVAEKGSPFHATLDFVRETEIETYSTADSARVIDLIDMKAEDVISISGAHRGTDALVSESSAAVSTRKGISVRGTREMKSPSKSESWMYGDADMDDVSDGSFSIAEKEMPDVKTEKAGQMTAGFWRDLDNWEKWNETHKDATVLAHTKTWNFNPFQRYSVQLTDAKNQPIIGQTVQLKTGSGEIVWTAVTDNKGKAELWANMNPATSTNAGSDYKAVVRSGERVFDFRLKPDNSGSEVLNIPINHSAAAVAEIAFVVDATGSMSDEIRFLQAELLDVIARVKNANKCLDLKIGSVFYRDHSDSYLTLKSDFSSNPVQVVNFISEQSAGGGGDFPEAVDAAMETAVTELTWTENTVSKIMFLILDAPPHSDASSVERMNKYTKLAAEKGIKIIPITASGIDQATEFLMKYLAVATNGTYVYITDHSGIGNSHEKPTGVKENVQYLNDLMVDLINQNLEWNGCNDSVNNQTPSGQTEVVVDGQWQAQFYPNPAINKIHIRSNLVPDQIQIYSNTGQLVKTIDQSAAQVSIDVSDLVTGVYIVKCRKNEQQITCRMLVMH